MKFLNFIKKRKIISEKKFDPKTYYSSLTDEEEKEIELQKFKPAKHKMKMHRVNALLKHLETLQFSTMMDVGCGWGFVTKHILDKFDITYCHCSEASPHLINQTKQYLSTYQQVEFLHSFIDELPSLPKVDLVLATGVLHHVKPEDIRNVLKKLLSYTNKYLIHDDPPPNFRGYENQGPDTANFAHDFISIYQELGHTVQVIPIPNHPRRVIYYLELN
jgi:hypothetical protein